MADTTRQQQIEDELRALLGDAGLPAPDEAAHLARAVVFLWYDTKAFLLIDLDEAPDEGALADLDLAALAADIRGGPPGAVLPFTGHG